jgi:hypothetical protein
VTRGAPTRLRPPRQSARTRLVASETRLRRRVQGHGHPDEARQGTGDVVPVGPEAVEGHAPQQRPGDEDATVGRQDPAEVRVGLQRGDEAVGAERNHPRADPQPPARLPDALPDQPRSPDLGDRGQHEQRDGPGDAHRATVAARSRSGRASALRETTAEMSVGRLTLWSIILTAIFAPLAVADFRRRSRD